MTDDSLRIFDPLTVRWFSHAIGTPTAVQKAAWPAIEAGGHTLVSAPTGTGKTLSAFLVFIDRLKAQARAGTLRKELLLIYVSPLKSLAGDIRENLRRPLSGILKEEIDNGIATITKSPDIHVAVRTGDTPQKDRRRMITSPPHILITTPESLYLMLTAQSGKQILKTARYIIIDELHALIDNKRGAHLMLSIARLDRLCGKPLQRIGLSATIEPLSKAAEFLAPEPVQIVAPKMRKEIRLEVTSPFSGEQTERKDAVWQHIARNLVTLCEGMRSAIAFVDSRAYAEKLAYYVNAVAGEGFARTHHGSISKDQRFEVERELRGGRLRLLCATSSMELGIDVGDIDRVFQVGCSLSISSAMQRLGRAGHNPGRISVMHIFPRDSAEGLYSGLAAEVIRRGGVEYSCPPTQCLDVLAQHLVSMASGEGYTLDDVMEILPRAFPFKDLLKQDVKDVLGMLAGDYEHDRDIPVRPRLLYDRIHERVEGDPYSRMLAVSAGGTIPDKGYYTVRSENGVKLGELDEEFVYESREGTKFMLGSFAWQIAKIDKDSVTVVPTTANGARPPYWNGEQKGRRFQTGQAYGEIFRKLYEANSNGALLEALKNLGLDEPLANGAEDFIKRQIAVTGVLPDDRRIIIEHFKDETGNNQIMVHSVFGRPVNQPLAILACEEAKRQTGRNIKTIDDDDGFILFPYDECTFPDGLLQAIKPDTAELVLKALLPATPIFNMTFRYSAAHALMMGVKKAGRQPLWVQRMRGAEMLDSLVGIDTHPLIRETKRECLEDYWDLNGLINVLNGIRTGVIEVHEIHLDLPSPMSLSLRRETEGAMMYDYTPTPPGIHVAVDEALNHKLMIAPDPGQLIKVSERTKLPENENQLHSLLMIEGDLLAGELDVPIEWLETLIGSERSGYIEPGLWVAAEHLAEYEAALNLGDLTARQHIVRRLLRYRGAQTPEQVADRYLWPLREAEEVLDILLNSNSAVKAEGLYFHAELYNRARRETVKMRRAQIKTLPAERYAALMQDRVRRSGQKDEQLEAALKALRGLHFPAPYWESILLPARVADYRPALLDKLLARGDLFWRYDENREIGFYPYEEIDWDADLNPMSETLSGDEKTIFDALIKRGPSFSHRLGEIKGSLSPQDILLKLAEKGFVCADSFVPVRHLPDKTKSDGWTVRQRVNARVMEMTSGRWEVARPLLEKDTEQLLERAFDRAVILSRETIAGLSWSSALGILRVWEYTGRVRRGYFVEGLSGVQFIRDKDFQKTMLSLEHPEDKISWLSAADPIQVWGKSLAHLKDRAFICVPGTAVALCSGVPAAVFERQGQLLRVFDESRLDDVVHAFMCDFKARRIFPSQNRVTVKKYPDSAAEVLSKAGFTREMRDYVLYR